VRYDGTIGRSSPGGTAAGGGSEALGWCAQGETLA